MLDYAPIVAAATAWTTPSWPGAECGRSACRSFLARSTFSVRRYDPATKTWAAAEKAVLAPRESFPCARTAQPTPPSSTPPTRTPRRYRLRHQEIHLQRRVAGCSPQRLTTNAVADLDAQIAILCSDGTPAVLVVWVAGRRTTTVRWSTRKAGADAAGHAGCTVTSSW
ncbi:MAG: hypothetical protein R2856_30760 [Caldilineaceae bacterium]